MSVTFSYPITEPEYSITLPNPDLDNSDSQEPDVKVYRSRNNTPYSVVQSIRVGTIIEDTQLVFSALSRTKIAELRDFLINTRGQYLRYTDHHGVDFITLMPEQRVNIESQGKDTFTVTLTLRKWQ